MQTKSNDRRFRPRLWLKRHTSAVPGNKAPTHELELSFSAAPSTSLKAPTTLDAAGQVPSPPSPPTSLSKKLKFPPLFSARKNRQPKQKKLIPSAPKPIRSGSTPEDSSPLAKSAPHRQSEMKADFMEDRFDETEDFMPLVATSLDTKKTIAAKKPSNSQSELSQMTAKMMNEEVKAKLQIQDSEETRNKVLMSLKLTEEPYASSSGSSFDVLNGVRRSGKVVPDVRRTALHSAVELGASVEVVTRLTENLKTVDVFAVTEEGDTALHLAARNRNSDLCIFLIKLGCDPNVPNLAQKTPVQLAGSELGYMMILSYWSMLKSRVESDTYADLAIQATRYGSVQMLRELAELGADLKKVRENASGKSLAEIARQSGHMELATALEENDLVEKANDAALMGNSSGNISFSTTSSLRKIYGPNHAHKHSSSGILDLPSDEVKALMNADTGTDVMNSPEENQGAQIGVQVNAAAAAAAKIRVVAARQLSQDLELSPSVEYDECSDICTHPLGHEINLADALPAQSVTYEKRPSRFSIRDLDE
jgi:hypothetical protein